MEGEDRTKDQLLEEINALRQQLLSFQQNPAHLHTHGREVSSADEQQLPLKISEELQQWETIFNVIGSAIWLLDADCCIRRSNKAAENIFHRPISDMIGKHCWEIAHGTSQPVPECPILRAIETRKRASSELQIGGQWFEVIVDVVSGASGEITGYSHIVSDITDRKHAQLMLMESEARYRLISENADDVIWLWDLSANRYVYVSPSVERLRKFTVEEMMNQTLNDALLPESTWLLTQELPRRILALESGDETARVQSYEMEQKCRDGSLVFTEVTTTLVTDTLGHVTHIQGITRNINERRKIELLLRKNEEKYRIVADFAYDWEYWLGLDGNLLYISPSSERITGHAPSDFLNDPELLEKIVHPDDQDIFARHLAECHEGLSNSCPEMEFRIIAKNGAIVWLEHKCQPVYLEDGSYAGQRASNRDVTERKRVEDDLQTSEKHLRAILEASTETIFLMDKQGRLLTANKITADRLKTDMETLKKANLFDLLPPDVAESRKKNIQHVIETGKPLQFEDERFGRTILNSIYPIHGKDHQVSHLAVFGIDITDRKTMQDRLRESDEIYRNLFHNNHATLLVIDPESGWIMDANFAACRYYGYDLSSLTGKKITEINVLTSEQVFEEMARAKAEQRDHFYFYHRLANGEIRPVEVYSGPIDLRGKRLLYSIIHDISERKKAEEEKERLILELRDAFSKIKTLSGMLPICASCKKIRDDQGYWKQIESYLRDHSNAEFSHSICPECMIKLYPEYINR